MRNKKTDEILAVKASHPELSSSQVGEIVGQSKDQVQKVIQRNTFIFSAEAEPATPPQPLRDVSNKRVVVGDVHAPDTDPKMLDKVVDVATHYGIEEIDFVGDLFNQDVFGAHRRVTENASFQREVKNLQEQMRYLKQYFKRMRWSRGNHDERLIAMTFAQLSMENLATMIVGNLQEEGSFLQVSACNFMWLESGGQPWMLAHQYEYKKGALAVADDLARMHQCNIVSHHEHHAGMSRSSDGRWTIVNNPMLCNPPEYTTINVTTKPRMQKGFTIIVDGWADQYVEGALYGLH